MINPEAQHEKITELLNSVAKRPAMYLGNAGDVEKAKSLLWGFNVGLLTILGDTLNMPEFLESGHLARGWEFRPLGVVPQMRDLGFSDEEIVLELVQITISCWENFFRREKS